MFYQRFMEMDVEMTPYHEVVSINGNSAILKNVYTEKENEIGGYDTFVYATQNRSITDLYFSLKGKCKEIYRVGDSVAPRMIEQAVWDGEEIGRELLVGMVRGEHPDMNNVLVFIEGEEGKITEDSKNIIKDGRKLAELLGGDLVGAAYGETISRKSLNMPL